MVLSTAGAENEEFTTLIRQRGQNELQAMQFNDGSNPRHPILVIDHDAGDVQIVAASNRTLRRTTASESTSKATKWNQVYTAPENTKIAMTGDTNNPGYVTVTATQSNGAQTAQMVDAFGDPEQQNKFKPYTAAGLVMRDAQREFYAVEKRNGGRSTTFHLYVAASELAKLQAQQGAGQAQVEYQG